VNTMTGRFISEEELRTFEGWLEGQAIDAAALTPEELKIWRGYFEEMQLRVEKTPKVGAMKLRPVAGEQKYAAAIRDQDGLWLTMWVRCSKKGEIFILYPREPDAGNPHASYHSSGRFHHKSHGHAMLMLEKQMPTTNFKGSEHLGMYYGHGRASGAVVSRTYSMAL
jgi:hypothetical protein